MDYSHIYEYCQVPASSVSVVPNSILFIYHTFQFKETRMTEESKANKNAERIFLTFQETQEFLGVSHQTLYKLIQQGLPSHKIGKKRVFLREELVQWIKDH